MHHLGSQGARLFSLFIFRPRKRKATPTSAISSISSSCPVSTIPSTSSMSVCPSARRLAGVSSLFYQLPPPRYDPKSPNCQIGKVTKLSLIEIHQNGGFTLVWLWMKTIISPFVVAAVYWYWNRVPCLLDHLSGLYLDQSNGQETLPHRESHLSAGIEHCRP